jgi:hypothetical protein
MKKTEELIEESELSSEEIINMISPEELSCPYCFRSLRSLAHADNHIDSCTSKPTAPIGRPHKGSSSPQSPSSSKPLKRMLKNLVEK